MRVARPRGSPDHKRKGKHATSKGEPQRIVFFSHQFMKFVVVGVLNTLFGYGCFAFFLYLGIHYSGALLLSTVLGVIFNFKTTSILVFGSHNNRLIVRFIGSYIIIYAINTFGVAALLHIGISPFSGGAILIIPMAVIAFILNKRFVFNYV